MRFAGGHPLIKDRPLVLLLSPLDPTRVASLDTCRKAASVWHQRQLPLQEYEAVGMIARERLPRILDRP